LEAPGGVFVDIAVSTLASCGVRAGGELVCWGEESEESSRWWRWRVVRGAPVHWEFSKVELWGAEDGYADRACGLRSDGVVVCWGQEFSALGDAAAVAADEGGYPLVWELRSGSDDGFGEGFVDIAASPAGVCGLRGDGSAACWDGQRWADVGAPGDRFEQVVASVRVSNGGTVCGLGSDGGFECFGGHHAREVPEGEFADVSVWLDFGCGVRRGGELVCWGDNEHGQADPPDGQFTQVSASETHRCALDVGGRAVCWGDNRFKQAAAPGGEFTRVEVEFESSCGLRAGGELVCWGWRRPPDRPFSPPGSFAGMTMGNRGALVCGLGTDQAVACWKPSGQRLEAPEGDFAGIAAVSGWDVCGLRPDGAASCWNALDGSAVAAPKGAFAQIPKGATPGNGCWLLAGGAAQCRWPGWDAPAVVDGEFTKITAGGRCGILADSGEILCWTHDMNGLVGAPPLDAEPLVRISASGALFLGMPGRGVVFCGISAHQGALSCWPWDRRAALHLGEGFDGAFTDVATAPNGSFCAIRADQTLGCRGHFAALEGAPAEPIVPPAGKFTQVAVARHHACAIRAGGEAECWGHAHDGAGARSLYLGEVDEGAWMPTVD
jgi:hypothetical protein